YEGDAMHPKAKWTWSPEFRRLVGFPDEASFPNVVQSWTDRLHPEDIGPTFEAFSTALATGRGYDVLYRLRMKDETYRWFRATGGVVLDAQGKPRRACGSLVDVHAAKLAEEERKRAMQTVAAEFETELGAVLEALAAAADRLRQDSDLMREAAQQTSRQTATIAEASEEATGSVGAVASATEQMTNSIQEIGEQIERSTQATNTATGQSEDATAVVQSLVGDVRRIGDVVKLISDIAGQTNLLALNATIEAAR